MMRFSLPATDLGRLKCRAWRKTDRKFGTGSLMFVFGLLLCHLHGFQQVGDSFVKGQVVRLRALLEIFDC